MYPPPLRCFHVSPAIMASALVVWLLDRHLRFVTIGVVDLLFRHGDDEDAVSILRMDIVLVALREDELSAHRGIGTFLYRVLAVIVLLALLSLGVKNIHLGPTLPAFLSPNVAKVLVDNFGIAGITTVDDDLKLLIG